MPLPGKTIFQGNPPSTAHQPDKIEAAKWAEYIESLTSAAQYGNTVWFETKSALDADLAHEVGTPAVVYGAAANNGVYLKSGASGAGSWARILSFLPGYQFVTATDAGSGTADAIVATAAPEVSYTDGAQLITLNISETNASDAVTVAFDGNAALDVKTASGSDPGVGALVAGMQIVGVVAESASQFRLLSDIASAAIQQAAEDARDAAATSESNAAASATEAAGYLERNVRARSANFDVAVSERADVYLVTASATASLPAAATAGDGHWFTLIADGADATIDPDGSEQINGSATLTVTDGTSVEVFCDGTGWRTDLPLFDQSLKKADTPEFAGLGIGTSSPTGDLEVHDDDIAVVKVRGDNNSAARASVLHLDAVSDIRARGILHTADDDTYQWFAGVPYTGNGYTIGHDTSQPEYDANSLFFITRDGDIGIGTDSPTEKFEVDDTVKATNFFRDGSQVYSRDNIVGTVSESGGDATGAAFESDSNANGNYIKYADGTMVCWKHSLTLPYLIGSACQGTWTFPAVFNDADEVAVTATITNPPGGGSAANDATPGLSQIGCFFTQNIGVADVEVQVVRQTGETNFEPGDNMYASLVAYGRWF